MTLRKFRPVANLCASGLKHRHILNIVMTSCRTFILVTHIIHCNDVI